MLNVSNVVNSPRLREDFSITRTTGLWMNGRFTPNAPTTLNLTGIIIPTSEDMVQTPNGGLIQGELRVFTASKLYETKLDVQAGQDGVISDEIIWKGENWKVLQVRDFSDSGYYRAVCTREKGA